MRLRNLNAAQKTILNFLYEMRNTPMTPPDLRISHNGIKQSLGMIGNLSLELDDLRKKGFILPFWFGERKFCKITLAGIQEIEKCVITTVEGELSTSRIGVKGLKKEVHR